MPMGGGVGKFGIGWGSFPFILSDLVYLLWYHLDTPPIWPFLYLAMSTALSFPRHLKIKMMCSCFQQEGKVEKISISMSFYLMALA